MHFLPILLGFMTLTPMISCAPAASSGGAVIDPASFSLEDFTAEFPEIALEKRAKTKAKPAAKPKVAAKPKPVPKPVAAKPAPKPVAKKPAPVPVAKKPAAAPAAKKPAAAPAAKKPAAAPAAKKPAPAPAAKKPAPAPAAKKPAPAPAKKPAPAPAKKPAAAPAKKPAPAPAKKPAAAPAKPATPAKKPTKTGTAKPAAKTTSAAAVCKRAPGGNCSNCAAFQTCDTCAAQRGCGFSTVTFKCSSVSGSPADTVVAANKRDRCPAVVQQARIFPGVQGKKTGVPVAVPGTPAGLPNANIRAAFAKIEPHIFTRESPSRPDSGQHLKSVWIANHTGAKAVPTCNATTGLCTFNDGSSTGKTVWNDDAGFYTRNDVKNMCSVALALSSGTNTRHVVMTPRNQKICIEARPQSRNFNAQTGAGQGSCFPIGTSAVSGKLDSTCS